MKHIADLFSKYKKTLTPPQTTIIKEFVLVCDEVCGYEIKKEQCSYTVSTKTIYLTTPSLLKNEILLQKNEVLKRLQEKLGKNSPKQII